MDLQEVGWDWVVLSGGMDSWLAFVNAVMNLRFP